MTWKLICQRYLPYTGLPRHSRSDKGQVAECVDVLWDDVVVVVIDGDNVITGVSLSEYISHLVSKSQLGSPT